MSTAMISSFVISAGSISATYVGGARRWLWFP
jgi:hypothetical protein